MGITLEEIRTNPTRKSKDGGRTEARKARAKTRAAAAAANDSKAAGNPASRSEPAEPFTLSAIAINARIVALRSLAKWLTERGVFNRSPLLGLKKRKPGQPRNPKGVLLVGEALRLIKGAAGLPVRFGMTGVERQAAYAAAIGTAMRLSGLKATRVRHWHLEAQPPFVELVHAKDAKKMGRKKVVADFVLPVLRAWFAGRAPNDPAMPPALTQFVSAKMVRRDLADLGMPIEDESGRRGFHSLRGSVATILSEHMEMGPLAKTLDHGDIKITEQKYAKNQLRELARMTNEGWSKARIQSGFDAAPNDTQRGPEPTTQPPPPNASAVPNTEDAGDLRPNTTPMRDGTSKPPAGLEPATSRLQSICEGGASHDSESDASNGLRIQPPDGRRIRNGFDVRSNAGDGAGVSADRPGTPADLAAVDATCEDAHARGCAALRRLAEDATGGGE